MQPQDPHCIPHSEIIYTPWVLLSQPSGTNLASATLESGRPHQRLPLASSHAPPCSSSPPIHSTTPAVALALSLRATPPRSLPLAPIYPSAAAPATSSRLRRLSPTVSLRCRLRSAIFFSPRSTLPPPLLPFSRVTTRRRSMSPPFLPLIFSAPSLTLPAASSFSPPSISLPLRRRSSFLHLVFRTYVFWCI
jgi:hypothetical protein